MEPVCFVFLILWIMGLVNNGKLRSRTFLPINTIIAFILLCVVIYYGLNDTYILVMIICSQVQSTCYPPAKKNLIKWIKIMDHKYFSKN